MAMVVGPSYLELQVPLVVVAASIAVPRIIPSFPQRGIGWLGDRHVDPLHLLPFLSLLVRFVTGAAMGRIAFMAREK